MENKTYPEWQIFRYDADDDSYDLCHLHKELEGYAAVDIRNKCCICDISAPDYLLFQVKLIVWEIVLGITEYGCIYSYSGNFIRGISEDFIPGYEEKIRDYIYELKNELQ